MSLLFLLFRRLAFGRGAEQTSALWRDARSGR